MSQGFASYAEARLDEFVGRIEAGLPRLPKQEAKVAQYFLLNLPSISFETGKSIAQKAGVAEITVGRMLRRFGCAGMKEFKAMLLQHYSVSAESFPDDGADLPPDWQEQMNAELQRQGEELVTKGTLTGEAHQMWQSVTAAFENNDEAAAERVEGEAHAVRGKRALHLGRELRVVGQKEDRHLVGLAERAQPPRLARPRDGAHRHAHLSWLSSGMRPHFDLVHRTLRTKSSSCTWPISFARSSPPATAHTCSTRTERSSTRRGPSKARPTSYVNSWRAASRT